MSTNNTLRGLLREFLEYDRRQRIGEGFNLSDLINRTSAALAEPVSGGVIDPSILDKVSLSDAEAANHAVSGAVYWNNAVTACKHVLREALNGGAVADRDAQAGEVKP